MKPFNWANQIKYYVVDQGHGTEADTAKGIEILQQAADVQNPGAMNTLGW